MDADWFGDLPRGVLPETETTTVTSRPAPGSIASRGLAPSHAQRAPGSATHLVRMAGLSILIFRALTLSAQNANHLNLRTGEAVFRAACTACHGIDGKGAPDSAVRIRKPVPFPISPSAIKPPPSSTSIGRPQSGMEATGAVTPIMPSFGESLTSEQMDLVIGYLRSFCHEKSWRAGRTQSTETAGHRESVFGGRNRCLRRRLTPAGCRMSQ